MITIIYILIEKKSKKEKKKTQYILFGMLVISIVATVRNYNVLTDGFYGKITAFSTKYIYIPDLNKYKSNPQIEYTKERMPKHFVLILGESFNKRHSSLYEYNKNTNPHLKSIPDSLLYTFKNVTSASTGTNPTYECILNTYNHEYGDSIEWYKCCSLQEVLSISGYTTYWISNQNEKGFYDVCATRQAELCDEIYFTNHGNTFCNTYDEAVIPLTKEVIEKEQLNFYFIHLLGSHPQFKQRYPEAFTRFTHNDYLDKPEHQRQTLADYDNSILYNDSVINEIINLFKDKESIIMYISDHGLDIFQAKDDYCGHAILGNTESNKFAREIPFIIYTSTLYANNNPSIIEKIKNNTEKSFNTVNLMYTIMDIMGIRFTENNDVEKYSLFAK